MVHALSLPTLCARPANPRTLAAQAAPLAAAGVLLIAAVLASTTHMSPAPVVSPDRAVATLVEAAPDAPASSLQAAAEGLRAELRALPGVGAVELRGLQTAGVEIRYSPARLASLGVREAELASSLRAEAVSPGVLAVGLDAAQAGPAPIADSPVHAGHHVLRLGDVAFVARTPLPEPIARLRQNGQPAVQLVVVPAPGEAGAALDRRVAQTLAIAPLPGGIELK